MLFTIILATLAIGQPTFYTQDSNIHVKTDEQVDDTAYVRGTVLLDEFFGEVPSSIMSFMSDGTCFLKRPIRVVENGKLIINGKGRCKVLRMYKDSYIRVQGSLEMHDVKVTSWDPVKNEVIRKTQENFDEVRPYINTEYPSHDIVIRNSEIAHLGFYNKELGGRKWGIALYGTENAVIQNNKFHDNYFGFYTFETVNASITGNEVYDNIEYGLDFHDYSNNFYVYNNNIYNNGNHGLIFSKYCTGNKIIKNYVHDNNRKVFVKGSVRNYGTHGIMLDQKSNDNLIKDNKVVNNRIGIVIDRSDNNVIENNIIENDNEDGFSIKRSNNIVVRNNIVDGTEEYAVFLADSSNVKFENNVLKNTKLPIRVRNSSDYDFINNTEMEMWVDDEKIRVNPPGDGFEDELVDEDNDVPLGAITGAAILGGNDGLAKVAGNAINVVGGVENFFYSLLIGLMLVLFVGIMAYVYLVA